MRAEAKSDAGLSRSQRLAHLSESRKPELGLRGVKLTGNALLVECRFPDRVRMVGKQEVIQFLPVCPSSANNRRQVSMKLSTIRNGARTESRVLSEDCGSHTLSRQVFRKVC